MLDSHSEAMQSLLDLFRNGTRLSYVKGEFIIRPGESPPGVFFINSGIVKAYDITKYGEENLLIIRKEKEIFPLIWALTNQERNIIYQALSDATVYRVAKESLQDLINSQPIILKPLLDMTLEMYRIHSERIINLEYRTAKERLISFLITMSQRFGQDTKEGIVITTPLRQQDIASSINTSRETASRELALLEKKGLIKSGGNIILTDVNALKEFL